MANNSAPVIPARPGILDEVKAAIGDAWLDGIHAVGEDSITVARESIAEVCRTLRDRFGYQQLMEIAGVDYPQRPERFEVVYHLLSVTKNHRIRIRLSTDEDMPVPSITGIYPVAGWLERECSTCTASSSTAMTIFAASSPITASRATRSARTSRSRAMSSCAIRRAEAGGLRAGAAAAGLRAFDFLSPWEGAQVYPAGRREGPRRPRRADAR
jgi:NADH-quinone oxidoreductase subunit C